MLTFSAEFKVERQTDKGASRSLQWTYFLTPFRFFFWSELLKYWHDNSTSDVLVDYQSWPAVAIEHYFYAPTVVNIHALKLLITVNEELSSFKRKINKKKTKDLKGKFSLGWTWEDLRVWVISDYPKHAKPACWRNIWHLQSGVIRRLSWCKGQTPRLY